MGDIRTRAYRQGNLEAEGFPIADVSDYLSDSGTLVWVDLCNPSESDLQNLADELGFHELAVEDVFKPQRPKLDHYASPCFCRAGRSGSIWRKALSRSPRSTRSSTSAG
jgi:magnesium transporter